MKSFPTLALLPRVIAPVSGWHQLKAEGWLGGQSMGGFAYPTGTDIYLVCHWSCTSPFQYFSVHIHNGLLFSPLLICMRLFNQKSVYNTLTISHKTYSDIWYILISDWIAFGVVWPFCRSHSGPRNGGDLIWFSLHTHRLFSLVRWKSLNRMPLVISFLTNCLQSTLSLCPSHPDIWASLVG